MANTITPRSRADAPPPSVERRDDAPLIAELREKLAASEDRFRAAAGGLLDAFYVLEAERDAEGAILDFRFVEANELGLKIIGMDRGQVIGQRLCELIPINRERGYFDMYARVVETGEPMLQEDSFGDVDGIEATWLQFQAVRVGDGVAIHTKDITERKAQEQETVRVNRELQMIFDAVPALIFFKDCNNNVLRVNQAVAEQMGLPIEEIEGRSTEELFPEEAAGYYRDDLAVLRSGQPKLGYIEPQTLPDGRRTWIRTDKSPLFDADGAPLGILGVVTDVTEQRRSELQAAVLEKAVEERQAMGRDLHDGIGQQLTGVRMLLEKVRKQAARGELPEPGALDEIAEVIVSASNEVRRMISGLTPERISAEELPVALAQVASNVQSFYGVSTVCDCDEDAAGLDEESANHFLAIAQEAAINAARHADAGMIAIRFAVDEAAFVLGVTDDGRGLPVEFGASEPSESTGRGLHILHHRAAAMGARLEVGASATACGDAAPRPRPSSTASPGTRVCCTLPR